MEARPLTENRHSGAPRGARPSGLRDAGRFASARPAALCAGQPVPLHRCACRRSAHSSLGVEKSQNPGRQTRRGNERCCSRRAEDDGSSKETGERRQGAGRSGATALRGFPVPFP
jgi:hypothetical protein